MTGLCERAKGQRGTSPVAARLPDFQGLTASAATRGPAAVWR